MILDNGYEEAINFAFKEMENRPIKTDTNFNYMR